MLRKVFIALSVMTAALFAAALSLYFMLPSSKDAIESFLEYGKRPTNFVTEDDLMDPLIVARGDVVPVVMVAIARTDLPRRRYAIGFLGNAGRREALPVLEMILYSEAEKPTQRGDALEAIALIDRDQGRTRAQPFIARPDALGDTARRVQSGDLMPRRSYQEALSHYICVKLTGC